MKLYIGLRLLKSGEGEVIGGFSKGNEGFSVRVVSSVLLGNFWVLCSEEMNYDVNKG